MCHHNNFGKRFDSYYQQRQHQRSYLASKGYRDESINLGVPVAMVRWEPTHPLDLDTDEESEELSKTNGDDVQFISAGFDEF